MKIEKDDFLLGLTFFLVVLVSKNTIKARKKNHFGIFLIGGIASEKNQSKGVKSKYFFNGSFGIVFKIQKQRTKSCKDPSYGY